MNQTANVVCVPVVLAATFTSNGAQNLAHCTAIKHRRTRKGDVADFKIYAHAADQTLCEVRPPLITLSISEKREAGVRAASRLSQPPPPLTFRNLRRSHGHRGQSSLDYVTEATYRPRMHSRRTVTDPEIILRWVDNARVS